MFLALSLAPNLEQASFSSSKTIAMLSQASTSHVEIQIVVIDELTPKPVALTDFILAGSSLNPPKEVRTDSSGFVQLDLAPGRYSLSSKTPTTFKGKSYSWTKEFSVMGRDPIKFVLTQSDAKVSVLPAARQLSDESLLYQKFRRSVVTVESDGGQGSGFLVDKRGLILTNYHVAGASTFVAVRFGPGQRYAANVISSDPVADVAVLRVNAVTVSEIEPLTCLATTEPLGIEGEKVVAIGSPLHQEKTLTLGIISKVEKDVLISDVNINHGNSGGPLLNMAGDVIGITTFGDLTNQGGPGISGIISIRKADKALAEAVTALDRSAPPSVERLPDVSSVEIPESMLDRIAQTLKGSTPYFKAPKNFRTYVETPFDAYHLQAKYVEDKRKKIARRYKGKVPPEQAAEDGPSKFWERYVGNLYQPLVTVKVIPWPQETSASSWNRALLGNAAGKAKFELRDDFARMVLLRDGKEVPPIRRSRIRDTQIYEGYDVEINDTAMAGVYAYDPHAFEPGAVLELRVWKNDKAEFTSIRFDKEQQERIWSMFKDWSSLRK